MSTIVLSFDIGIRNLAWCLMSKHDSETNHVTLSTSELMSKEGSASKILGWQNYDLLAGEGHETADTKLTCSTCSAKATYESRNNTLFCVRHCPAATPALRDASGTLMKKIPDMATLRGLLESKQVAGKDMKTKVAAVAKLSDFYSLPIQKKKVKKAVDTELAIIHDGMRKFVTANREAFSGAKYICLENQPALKNPTMKSVQILLFATLRDLLQPNPPKICLVHAGKKVQGKESGDAGYKARKDGGEERVRETLKKTTMADSERWLAFFESHKKRNDLADAFCMCVDKLNG